MSARIGIVAIGRNEGERLRKCLASAIGRAQTVVYVDSGSTDGSAQVAREMGAAVVDLDLLYGRGGSPGRRLDGLVLSGVDRPLKKQAGVVRTST